ncbi:MAG: ComEC family competence protein, partial [Proteobacteria bacterium]|nr:ComEC family competence protein [Pseudomonadota bacterium]
VLGTLWLAIWQRRPRWLGIPVMVLALALVPFQGRPNLIVDGRARAVAISGPTGKMQVSTLRRARFEVQSWRRLLGIDAKPEAWPADPEVAVNDLRCDSLGCIWMAAGRRVAIAFDEAALEDDCRSGDIVISLVPARRRCQGVNAAIDRFDLWRGGTHALYVGEGRTRIETVTGERGHRPWIPNLTSDRRQRQ